MKIQIKEINKRIREAFEYDEYKYQKENGILITEPNRARGMHKELKEEVINNGNQTS